jgi:hypothetical protein
MPDVKDHRKDAVSIPVMAPDRGRLIVIDISHITMPEAQTFMDALFDWLRRRGGKGFSYNLSGPEQQPSPETDFLFVAQPNAHHVDRETVFQNTILPFLRGKRGRLVIVLREKTEALAPFDLTRPPNVEFILEHGQATNRRPAPDHERFSQPLSRIVRVDIDDTSERVTAVCTAELDLLLRTTA